MNKDNQLIFEAYANKHQRVCENAQPVCTTDAYGTKSWYIQGKLHREDGPAIEYANGTKGWFINGEEYSDVQKWAKAVLQSRNKPAGSNDVQEFLRTILQKQTKDLI